MLEINSINLNLIDLKVIIGFIIILLLLFASAMMSASEVAFFSLTPTDIHKLQNSNHKKHKKIIELLNQPKELLATILLANNFVNIGIVIISTFITNQLFNFTESPVLSFFVQVILVTFVILLFGEIMPKVYSSHFAYKFANFIIYPMIFVKKIFSPLSAILVSSSGLIDKKFAQKKVNISIDDISQALELTKSHELKDEEKILKGIVKFGNINVNEVMKPRVDVVGIDLNYSFGKVLSIIIESGYSRIPVYQSTIDNVKGILYIKDLLPHFHKGETFRWQSLIRPPYFVPETKKINDLLEDFQRRKMHMAVVIDEFGGSSGIITLEDIIEEIVGEITDEFDSEDKQYIKTEKDLYIFEAKILLNDFSKIFELPDDYFDSVKRDADTLAGLLLELKGEIPTKNETLSFGKFEFKIKSADNRRIKQIFVKEITSAS
jgi:gliding motility-associated protein GldE